MSTINAGFGRLLAGCGAARSVVPSLSCTSADAASRRLEPDGLWW